MALIRTLALAVALATSAVARTDLDGCTYYDSVVKPKDDWAYATRVWYVPDTGELCQFLDCGGGRAPPKYTVPGCPLYTGTETYSPTFINLQTINGAISASTVSSTAPASAVTTPASSPAPTKAATTEPSVTILTGTNTASESSKTGSGSGTSSAHNTHSSSKGSESASGTAGSSSSATTTKPSSGAGPVPTVAAVLGAIAAGLAL